MISNDIRFDSIMFHNRYQNLANTIFLFKKLIGVNLFMSDKYIIVTAMCTGLFWK